MTFLNFCKLSKTVLLAHITWSYPAGSKAITLASGVLARQIQDFC